MELPAKESEERTVFTPPDVEYPISRDELIELYWNQKLSTYEIGKKIGMNARTVSRWMKRHGVQARTLSDAVINSYWRK